MRKSLLLFSLFGGTVLLTTKTNAQQADRVAYSMTDVKDQNNNWVYLRQLNMSTGIYSNTLIDGMESRQVAYDAFTKKQIGDITTANKMGFNEQPAFNSGVAALAFDRKNDRLYYTPMFIDQLRYIDLKSMKIYYVPVPFTNSPIKSSDQGNIVTRMVIASDGNGYAMTNDGMHLIQFTTNKRSTITDLGAVVDDQANKNISIHNSCSSFGGDMIADDNGNLYIFSARNHVFKVNIESKVATHLGVVSGLPANYTINGAAVTDNNQVLIASASESASLYKIDTKTWVASPSVTGGATWHTSDLASSNLLASGTKPKSTTMDLVSRNLPANTGDGKVNIYPNPVTNNQFVIQFNKLEAGTYNLQVTDVMGRQVIQQNINVGGDNQSQTVKMSSSVSKGVYLVNIMDKSNKAVYTSKIVLE